MKKKLLERVEELEKYASDFFGRLREVFANNPDIKVVGDRFVFQSEVLFASGEATLSASGSGDLDKFAMVYQQLAARLPPDLPVIIEVQVTPTGFQCGAAFRPTGSCPRRGRSRW